MMDEHVTRVLAELRLRHGRVPAAGPGVPSVPRRALQIAQIDPSELAVRPNRVQSLPRS